MEKHRTQLALATVASAAAVLASCGVFSDDHATDSAGVLNSFTKAIEAQDASRAADLTTAPDQANAMIAGTLQGMSPQSVSATVRNAREYSNGSAQFAIDYTWDLGDHRNYSLTSAGTARKLSTGWRIQWSPTVLAPDLDAGGRLQLARTDATPAPAVLDRGNSAGKKREPWMKIARTNTVVIDPGRTKDVAATIRRVAAVIAPITPLVTRQVITQAVEASSGKPANIVTLRDSDMKVLAGDPARIPGVSVTAADDLLTTDRRIDSPLVSGTRVYWQAIRDATSGWAVQRVSSKGAVTRLAGQQGPPAPSFGTSLSSATQLAVNTAVVDVAQPATMLVLDAKSGSILAAANNSAANAAGLSLQKADTVGSTIDPVIGAVQKNFPDDHSARQGALDRLGLGVRYTIAGVTPVGDKESSAATFDAVSVGGDAAMVSPISLGAFGVAMARGSSIAPTFVDGAPSSVTDGALGRVDPSVYSAVYAAMKKTVTSGDASDITGAQGMRALVGTNGPQGPGWFVGIVDNQVVVVHATGEHSGIATLQLVQKYLRNR